MNMRITKLRTAKGNRLTGNQYHRLKTMLEKRFEKAGFITRVQMEKLPTITIGLGMKSFIIDKVKLGQNADTGQWAAKYAKKGYKRTSIPTWEEREDFNHIINDCLDKLKLKANVYNSYVAIRHFDTGRVDNWDLERFGALERYYYEIVKESSLEVA